MVVFLAINLTPDERQAFLQQAAEWKPAPDRLSVLTLEAGWELFIPDETTVIYATVALTDSLHDGGVLWKKQRFLHVLASLCRMIRSQALPDGGSISNQSQNIMQSLRIGLGGYCRYCIGNGTWHELAAGQETVEEFVAAVREAEVCEQFDLDE